MSDDGIEQLASAAAANDADAASALGKAVFGLDTWYSIPRGEADSVQPLVLEVDGVPTLLLWTAERTAVDAGRELDVIPADGDPQLLAMPSDGVVDLASAYAEAGIERVLFDHGGTPFLVELGELAELRQEALSAGG